MAGVGQNTVSLYLLHASSSSPVRFGEGEVVWRARMFAQASEKLVESAPSGMAMKGSDLLVLAMPQPKSPGGGVQPPNQGSYLPMGTATPVSPSSSPVGGPTCPTAPHSPHRPPAERPTLGHAPTRPSSGARSVHPRSTSSFYGCRRRPSCSRPCNFTSAPASLANVCNGK